MTSHLLSHIVIMLGRQVMLACTAERPLAACCAVKVACSCLQWLDLQAGNNGSLLAWNYYPPKQRSSYGEGDKEFRLHAHADTDFLTLVFQRPGEACSLCTFM